MKKIIFAFILLNTLLVQSQSYLGNITSNYAGAIGNQLNPASFVDGRVKFDLTLPAVAHVGQSGVGRYRHPQNLRGGIGRISPRVAFPPFTA